MDGPARSEPSKVLPSSTRDIDGVDLKAVQGFEVKRRGPDEERSAGAECVGYNPKTGRRPHAKPIQKAAIRRSVSRVCVCLRSMTNMERATALRCPRIRMAPSGISISFSVVPGVFFGRVTDSSGQPIAEAPVKLYAPDEPEPLQTLTNAEGLYSFDRVIVLSEGLPRPGREPPSRGLQTGLFHRTKRYRCFPGRDQYDRCDTYGRGVRSGDE